MVRAAFFVACLLLSVRCYSQTWEFSRSFPTSRKNVPVAVINNDARYFFLLRYNKEVHDMIIERRKKPTAEIMSISPLRMDSVNASWFDYLNLGYLFFEDRKKIFYLFEKILNSERTLYLKYVDSTGKAGPFVTVQNLVSEKNNTEIGFEYKLTNENQILIISSRHYWNGTVKKQVTLYDPQRLTVLWQKQLPVESPMTGYSSGFECNEQGDLFYFLVQSSVVSQKRVYKHHQQMMEPVLFYNLIELKSFSRNNEIYSYILPVKDVWGLYGASVFPVGDKLSVHLHYSSTDVTGRSRVYFYNALTAPVLDTFNYEVGTMLSAGIDSMLTYYDGSDENNAASKEFYLFWSRQRGNKRGFLAERQQEFTKKEAIYYEVDLSNGAVVSQFLLPRKYGSIDELGARRDYGSFRIGACRDVNYFTVPENKRNARLTPDRYSHKEFKKQRELGGSLAVYYTDGGMLKRNLFDQQGEFVFVPLNYSGFPCESILYLYKGKLEKFAILKFEDLH